MNLNNGDGDGVSFVIKILPSDSVDYLRLPSDFAMKHLEKGSNMEQITLVLKPKSGVKWSVKYMKIEDKYYLMDGWLEFVKDNRLHVDDLLVFWLLAASPKPIFQVFCYAPRSIGCLKHPVSSTGNFHTSDRRPLLEDKLTGNGKKRFVEEETNEEDDDYDDEEDDGDDDNDYLQKGHKLFIKKVLRKSYRHHLVMTLGFWKANGLDGYDFVRLRTDQHEGKIWKVEVGKYGRRKYPYLTRGWCYFWSNNKLKMGSTLKITHVKGNLLHVDVIKGKQKQMN